MFFEKLINLLHYVRLVGFLKFGKFSQPREKNKVWKVQRAHCAHVFKDTIKFKKKLHL